MSKYERHHPARPCGPAHTGCRGAARNLRGGSPRAARHALRGEPADQGAGDPDRPRPAAPGQAAGAHRGRSGAGPARHPDRAPGARGRRRAGRGGRRRAGRRTPRCRSRSTPTRSTAGSSTPSPRCRPGTAWSSRWCARTTPARRSGCAAARWWRRSPASPGRCRGAGWCAWAGCRYAAVATRDFHATHFADGVGSGTLGEAPIVAFDRNDSLQHDFIRRVTRRHLAPPATYLPSVREFDRAIRVGMGWGLLPESDVAVELERGELVELVPGPPARGAAVLAALAARVRRWSTTSPTRWWVPHAAGCPAERACTGRRDVWFA